MFLKKYERVMNNIKNAIDKIGLNVSVETKCGTREGIAVLYPVRYDRNLFGGTENGIEGRTNPERYMMFCESRLLKNAEYGDVVYEGENSFTVLWVDEYESRIGKYIKACLRKRG